MEDIWVIYRFNQYNTPKISTIEVKGYDILSAIQNSGVVFSEIICVKLKAVTETVANL